MVLTGHASFRDAISLSFTAIAKDHTLRAFKALMCLNFDLPEDLAPGKDKFEGTT